MKEAIKYIVGIIVGGGGMLIFTFFTSIGEYKAKVDTNSACCTEINNLRIENAELKSSIASLRRDNVSQIARELGAADDTVQIP